MTTAKDGIADNGPAWRWIDTGPQPRAQTSLQARSLLHLAHPPREATLRVCANHLYRLFVNGQEWGRGPVRGDPRWPAYDSYDLLPCLREGANTIVLLVHHFDWAPFEATGAFSSGWRLYNGPAGLWVNGTIDGQPLDAQLTWQGRLTPGWHNCTERITRFLAYQHEVDLHTFARAMAEAEAEDPGQGWQPLRQVESPLLGTPEARPTPPLVPTPRHPVRLTLLKPSDPAIYNLQGIQRYEQAHVATVAEGYDAWLTYDLGYTMGGFPEIQAETAGEGRIDVYLGDGGQSRRTDRLHLQAGQYSYQPMDWRGGRTITLQVTAARGAMQVHGVRMIEMVYPFRPVGHFECSDPTLTQLWQVCRRTAWVSVKDHLVDCLGREQAMWIADANIHSRAIQAAFGDMAPVRKVLRHALQVMHEDGVMPVPGPCAIGYKRSETSLPWSEQPLTVAMTLRDLHDYDGKADLLHLAMPRLEAMYRLFEGYLDPRGLLVTHPPGRPALMAFGGWNPFLKRGVPTALNCEYVASLDAAADIAGRMGRDDLAARWTAQAARTREAVVNAFWDPNRRLFIDGELDGHLQVGVSPTVNAWAALAGAVPAEERGAWAAALRDDPGILPPVTPFDATLLLQALTRLGHDLHGRDLLDRYFGSIVRAGEPTLPEYWIADAPPGAARGEDSSACHPYGAGPAYLLPEILLGVCPDVPGFATARIEPRTLGLTSASGRVPTPHGPIGVAWRREEGRWILRIELPAGVAADVRLPRLGWLREQLVVNERVVWQGEPPARENAPPGRWAASMEERRVNCHLESGGSYELELKTL